MKSILKSKTIWANIITVGALFLQAQFGFIINPEEQIAILAVVNIILRLITTEELI